MDKMKYYSTRDKNNIMSFRTAVMDGLAKDGGLFMPEAVIPLPSSMISNIDKYSFQEISYEIAKNFVGEEISHKELLTIIESAINFQAPLVGQGSAGRRDAGGMGHEGGSAEVDFGGEGAAGSGGCGASGQADGEDRHATGGREGDGKEEARTQAWEAR